MKTISAKPISTKPISLSKAAKTLSKFVSAENGASQAISAYLHRASASFNELNQFHKELKLSRSDQKRKRQRPETIGERGIILENPTQSVDISQELNYRALQSKNKSRRHKFGGENTDRDERNLTQCVAEFSREPNGALAGSEDGNMKQKKKKQKEESRKHGETLS